jgi:C1A family cysteine protease
MNKKRIKLFFIILVTIIFIFSNFSVSSINTKELSYIKLIEEKIKNKNKIIESEEYYYVMDYLPLPSEYNQSPKPKTFSNYPSEFSWTDYEGNDWTTTAKNQGPCGSCWAFGAVSCLESIINIAWETPDLDLDLSEQYILSCLSASGSCRGGNSYSAFKYIKNEEKIGNFNNG